MYDGKLWEDNSKKPDEGTLIIVEIEAGFSGPGPDPTEPVPCRMIIHDNPDVVDPCPAILMQLDLALEHARIPPNWILTPAEKKMNIQALLALEAIKDWESQAYDGMFLKNLLPRQDLASCATGKLPWAGNLLEGIHLSSNFFPKSRCTNSQLPAIKHAFTRVVIISLHTATRITSRKLTPESDASELMRNPGFTTANLHLRLLRLTS
jgi:hypothetical protein